MTPTLFNIFLHILVLVITYSYIFHIRYIYLETLPSIRGMIQDESIWVSINETTDIEGRFIGNVAIGKYYAMILLVQYY